MNKIKLFNEFNGIEDYKLLTSNKNKLKEYGEYIPSLKSEEGRDLPEVLSDPITVALYKGLDNGPYTISEDTSLEVSGHDVGVNIKWLKHMMPKMIGEDAIWRVLLVRNTGDKIKVYEGIVEGKIMEKKEEGRSFSPYFFIDINGEKKSLLELRDSDVSPLLYSARAKAAQNLKNDNYIVVKDIKDIPEWKGEWQND